MVFMVSFFMPSSLITFVKQNRWFWAGAIVESVGCLFFFDTGECSRYVLARAGVAFSRCKQVSGPFPIARTGSALPWCKCRIDVFVRRARLHLGLHGLQVRATGPLGEWPRFDYIISPRFLRPKRVPSNYCTYSGKTVAYSW